MEIRCKKEDCKHNTGCSCCAGVVQIDRGTHCDSYVHNSLKEELIQENGSIFKVDESIAPQHLKNVPLECRAKSCIHNREESCTANGITVIDDEDDDTHADCATFCES